jgi:hypothetical protein
MINRLIIIKPWRILTKFVCGGTGGAFLGCLLFI